jgi:acetyl-CoA C-acetyltransferase
MADAYLYDGLRTPFGRHAGVLAPLRPDDLLAGVIRALVARNPFPLDSIEDVVAGCASQAGEDSRNVARHAGLLAGLPASVPGVTLNRLCGSGLAALLDAARAAGTGQGAVFVAGGVESMSRAPFVLSKSDSAYSRDVKLFDSAIGARFPNPALEKQYGRDTLAETADNIGREHGISREDSDRFALASQHKHPRADSSYEKLASLKPLMPNGFVTAGNASGINDGAGALLIATLEAGEKVCAKPLARIVSGAVAGVEPRLMGLGPVPAIAKALARANLKLSDMDVIEINEAFATQVLGCLKLLGLPFTDARVNPNGGAIAVGHPLGASGTRLALTAARQLRRSAARYALVSMCIGVGQGIAVILERA